MSIRILCAVFAAALFCTTESRSQIAVPIGTLPTYYNAGFAGEAGAPRVASFSYLEHSFNTGTATIPQSTSVTNMISVDHFLKKIRSGVAFTAGVQSYDGVSKGGLVSMAISPKFSFKGKYTFSPFADLSYARFHTRLPYEVAYPTEFPSNFVTHSLRIQSGFLINSARAYFGVSANVANYATDIYARKEKWRTLSNMVYTLQAGYTFQRTPESRFSFTPQLALSFMRFDTFDASHNPVTMNIINLMDLNLMFRFDKFLAGINSTGFVLGYQTERFRLQMTNFYSRTNKTGKTIEISEHTHFNTKPYSSFQQTYTGNIALRYVFRKKEGPKIGAGY